MTQNPFETPIADPQYARVEAASGRIDIGAALSDAWQACWANFPLWLGVGIVGTIINWIAGITIIGYFIVTPVLMYGWTKFLLNMLERDRAEFNDLFAGFSNFGAALVPMLATFMLMVVPVIPMMVGAVAESEVLIGLGGVIMAAFYLVVIPRIGFAFFFIVERGMGAGEAVRASWEATKGQWLTVFGLCLLAGVVTMAGYIALIIGVIPATQIAYLMFASAYRQLSGPAPARAY
jgi:hypothetical protein